MRWPPWLVAGAVVLGGLLVAGAGFALQRRRRTPAVAYTELPDTFKDGFAIRKQPVRFVVVHHTDTASPQKTVAALKSRGLATHFEVDQQGRIFRYLDPLRFAAYHAGWANGQSIGVDATHKSGASWPPAQVEAVVALVRWLTFAYDLPGGVAPDGVKYTAAAQLPAAVGVVRHRNVRPTSCPEDFPMAALGPVVELV